MESINWIHSTDGTPVILRALLGHWWDTGETICSNVALVNALLPATRNSIDKTAAAAKIRCVVLSLAPTYIAMYTRF